MPGVINLLMAVDWAPKTLAGVLRGWSVIVLDKLRNLRAEIGLPAAVLYLANRLLDKAGGIAAVYRYALVAQPVAEKPLLPGHRGRSIEIRMIDPRDPALVGMDGITTEVLEYRAGMNSVCFGAFEDGAIIGCLWLCLGPYDEDEVRCRFLPLPEGQASWDYGIFLRPEHRKGLAFARLWDAANAFLRERGVRWSLSRISAFNPASLASHRRLGATRIGSATFLRIGPLQVMGATLPPYVHVSATEKTRPCLRLEFPDASE